jgi:hypothetical protein
LSSRFACQLRDARDAQHRNDEITATMPSRWTMRFGLTTDFLVSSAATATSLVQRIARVEYNQTNHFSMVGPRFAAGPVRRFAHRDPGPTAIHFLQRLFANTTGCAQTAAKLIRTSRQDTAGAASAHVNWLTSARCFRWPICRRRPQPGCHACSVRAESPDVRAWTETIRRVRGPRP